MYMYTFEIKARIAANKRSSATHDMSSGTKGQFSKALFGASIYICFFFFLLGIRITKRLP